MGMFGKKDGKFIVLMVCSAAVCLVTVAAPTEPVLAWCGFGGRKHAGMSPKIANESAELALPIRRI